MYVECSATGQPDQRLADFQDPRTNSKLVDKFRVPVHGALPKINFKILAKARPSLLDQDFFLILTSKNKTQAKRSASFSPLHIPAVHFPSCYLLHSPRLYSVLFSVD
jgi:hypothetical protein